MCRKQEVILCCHFVKPITFTVTNPDWPNVLTNEHGDLVSLYQGHLFSHRAHKDDPGDEVAFPPCSANAGESCLFLVGIVTSMSPPCLNFTFTFLSCGPKCVLFSPCLISKYFHSSPFLVLMRGSKRRCNIPRAHTPGRIPPALDF